MLGCGGWYFFFRIGIIFFKFIVFVFCFYKFLVFLDELKEEVIRGELLYYRGFGWSFGVGFIIIFDMGLGGFTS